MLQKRNYVLFGVLLGMLVFLLLPNAASNRLLMKSVFSLAFIACLYTISTSRRFFLAALILLLPGLVSNWLDELVHYRLLIEFSLISQVLFLIYAAGLILQDVLFSRHRVTPDTILGAVNVYLILGVIWTLLYHIALLHDPTAFRFFGETLSPAGIESSAAHISQLTYYSFVTLSTLGYGDVTAAAPITRLLAVFEALVAQLYLVILVAGLVGRRAELTRISP